MSDQTTQQALPTGTWSADGVHSTVGFAVPYFVFILILVFRPQGLFGSRS